MSLEEYEILGILGDTISCSSYKVQNKITKTMFAWHAVDCSSMKADEKQELLRKLNERKTINHPHFLRFHNYVEHTDSKVLYISTDFHKNGSLKDVILKCNKSNMYICEELVIRIIYQICFVFKTSKNIIYSLKLESIFLDDYYVIKFFNFAYDNNMTKTEIKMLEFMRLVSQLCMVKISQDITDFTSLTMYSKEFRTFLNNLLDNIESPVHKCIDKILCHPLVLSKSSQWTSDKCFTKCLSNESMPSEKANICIEESSDNHSVMQRLRKWEQSLKMKENHLKEREYLLAAREKKINLIEKSIKEKLTQAELYLKRCRDTKSASSDSTKSSRKSKKITYENLDTTYSVDCDDSVIVPTSSKLNIEKLPKPSCFVRTFSERKVRFKGHSPLKEIDYNKRRIKSTSKPRPLFEGKSDLPSEINSGKSNSSSINTRKNVYMNKLNVTNENLSPENSENKNLHCRPISWSEENKKQAFELLRIMNSSLTTRHLIGDVKHTYL